MDEAKVFLEVADGLAGPGWVVIDNFLDPNYLIRLLEEQKILLEEGEFRKAGIGRGQTFLVKPEIRSDMVLWLDENNLSELQQTYWDKINRLKALLNQELFAGVNSFEAHFAIYPPGSFYRKHLDQFREARHRKISCLIYLNQEWTEQNGGHLRIYNNEQEYLDFLPVFGRFICFRSDLVFHEVLPTNKERYSITGWLRN